MKKTDCVFCNYGNDDVIIYKHDKCYAIISNNPINKYHVLLIPQEHYQHFIELPEELTSHFFTIAQKLSKALRGVCNPDAITRVSDDDISEGGFNLISHYELHLIPRFARDMHLIDWSQLRNNESNKARSKYANDVKKHS